MPQTPILIPELTREQVQQVLVQPLEERSIILSSGVQIINTDGSPVRIPRLDGLTEAPEWVGPSEVIPDTTEGEFSEVLLMPRTLKSVKTITRVSEELARQAVVNVPNALAAKIVRDTAGILDDAFITGNGAIVGGNRTQPLGLLNWPGTQSVPSVGALTLDDLHDAVGLALAANVDTSRLRWIMTPETFVSLRKVKDTQDRYQLQPDPTEAGVFRLLGHPVIITSRIPTLQGVDPDPDETSLVLADMSTVAVARDINAEVRFLTELYAGTGEIGVRVVSRYDIAPTLPQAIVVLRGVSAAA